MIECKTPSKAGRLALLWRSTLLAGCLLLPATAALTLAPPANAQWALAQAASISSSQAAEAVRARFGGRVLNVDRREREGRMVYRVKILQDDGRLRTVLVDANSGRILNP